VITIRYFISVFNGDYWHWKKQLQPITLLINNKIIEIAPKSLIPAMRSITTLSTIVLEDIVGPRSREPFVNAPIKSINSAGINEAFHYTSMLIAGLFAAINSTRGLQGDKFLELCVNCFGDSEPGVDLFYATFSPEEIKGLEAAVVHWRQLLNKAFGVEDADPIMPIVAIPIGLASITMCAQRFRNDPNKIPDFIEEWDTGPWPESFLIVRPEKTDHRVQSKNMAGQNGSTAETNSNEIPGFQISGVDSPSRNLACPCGSGKRLKNCCGKLHETPEIRKPDV